MNELTMNECSKRKLDETYLVVYAIKNDINIKKGDYIEKGDIYTLVGIDMKGYRQLITFTTFTLTIFEIIISIRIIVS